MVTKVTINEAAQAEVHAHAANLTLARVPAIDSSGRSRLRHLITLAWVCDECSYLIPRPRLPPPRCWLIGACRPLPSHTKDPQPVVSDALLAIELRSSMHLTDQGVPALRFEAIADEASAEWLSLQCTICPLLL